MSRRQAREKALQTLFQVELGKVEPRVALAHILEEFPVRDEVRPFLEELVMGALHELPALDEIIRQVALAWNLERMANVDRNILRLALYEIYFREDIPINVSINEAIELAKTYGDAESWKFINGILGKIAVDPEKYKPRKGQE